MFSRPLASHMRYTAPAALLAVCASSFSSTSQTEPAPDRLDRWKKLWSGGATRWHRADVHPSLDRFLDEKVLPKQEKSTGSRIFVPLCGKSVDMAYLANKNLSVVGLDGVPAAMEQFSNDHPDLNIQAAEECSKSDKFNRWVGKNIVLLCGDFFDLDETESAGKFDAVWDRAALVAIQPTMREDYVGILGKVLAPGGSLLLSTYIRPNGDTETGPPFSIDEDIVRELFEGQPWVDSVELLDAHSALSLEPWYRAIMIYFKMGNIQEKVFLIKAKE